MNKQERWLYEHLSYELLMLRYTHKQLQVPVDTTHEQLVWNANYDAFAVYARNLYLFLTNDRDPRNFKARDYADFSANKTPLVGIMDNLHQQVFHPGKQRTPPNDAKRVGLLKANRVKGWVEENMEKFVRQLKGGPYASIWKPEFADLQKIEAATISVGYQQDTTSNHVGMLLATIVSAAPTK